MKKFLLLSFIPAALLVGCSGEPKIDGSADKTATSNVEIEQKGTPRSFGGAVEAAPASGASEGIGK